MDFRKKWFRLDEDIMFNQTECEAMLANISAHDSCFYRFTHLSAFIIELLSEDLSFDQVASSK